MPTEFAAFVAIDWADQKHAWALQVPGSSNWESGTIDHTPEAIDVWATELRLRFSGQRVAVALEQSRGALVFMLTNTSIWSFSRFTPPFWSTAARAFDLREPRTIAATPDSCWTS
jgi:hypothetical protein